MRLIPNEKELLALSGVASVLKEANRAMAKAKKDAGNAKAFVAKWLKEKRNIDIETLPIGEIVAIEGALMVEVGSANVFDEAGFAVEQPELYAKHKKDAKRVSYKPLV